MRAFVNGQERPWQAFLRRAGSSGNRGDLCLSAGPLKRGLAFIPRTPGGTGPLASHALAIGDVLSFWSHIGIGDLWNSERGRKQATGIQAARPLGSASSMASPDRMPHGDVEEERGRRSTSARATSVFPAAVVAEQIHPPLSASFMHTDRTVLSRDGYCHFSEPGSPICIDRQLTCSSGTLVQRLAFLSALC